MFAYLFYNDIDNKCELNWSILPFKMAQYSRAIHPLPLFKPTN